MKDIKAVTTFHQEGLDLYGQRFINSFAQNVDKKIKLYVYAENCSPYNPDPAQILILDQIENLPKLNIFKEKWKNIPKANGECPRPKDRPLDNHKKFKWDAIRFSNKVYAVFDLCKKVSDWCVWIDADTYVHSPWSYTDFSSQLPDHSWITYVGRGKKGKSWPECGFYGLNLKTDACKEFIAEFEKFYEDADNGIFTLKEWHDSYVFGHLLNIFMQKYPNVYDYSSNLEIRANRTGGGGHPLINSDLGKWIDHMKGDRKKIGKSSKSDIIVNRLEKYWK